jgi:polysaccharide pyruvyl transferase WcaK-like protein
MDIVVAARYHGVLISHLLHKPVLAVSYHQKTTDLMARMGQSECTLEIDACTLDALKFRFLFLESQTKVIEAELERRVPLCRTILDAQYDRVFGLLEHTTA